MEPSEDRHGGEGRDTLRHKTASGAITAALALGMRNAHEPKGSGLIGVEQEARDQPVDTEGVELRFDPLSSRGTVVVVHRHDDEHQPPGGDILSRNSSRDACGGDARRR